MTATFREDFTHHSMPSGASCFYKDEDHSYWSEIEPRKKREPEGEWKGKGRLTGVTTVVAPFDWEPGGLMAWAVRMNLEAVAELVGRELGEDEEGNKIVGARWLLDPREIQKRIGDAQLSDEDYKDERGDIGSNVHLHTLNALAAGEPVPAMDQLTEIEQAHGRAVSQFWLDHDPEALQAEQVVCDLGLGIAGRLDFRGYLRSKCDDQGCPCQELDRDDVVILDLKTGKWIGAPEHVQVAGYDHLARVCSFGMSVERLLLKTTDEGEYRLIRSHASRDDFLTAIEVYRRAAAIRKAANADRKAREE